MNKSLKESQENTNKQLKETHKTVQDIKMEIEAIKEIQTEEIQEEKFRNSNRNHRRKLHQHNTRDRDRDCHIGGSIP